MAPNFPPPPTGPTLQVAIGVEEGPDALGAALAAATAARHGLAGAAVHLAIVVTTAAPRGDLVAAMQGLLGPVNVTGGVTAGLLTDRGLVTEGALVIGVSNVDGATTGVAATSGRALDDAAQAAARLVLAGSPSRGRYPRGVSFAFAAQGSGPAASGFLSPWRELMGAKMRTVCGTMSSPVVFGASATPPLASVACLEASYALGLGLAEGTPSEVGATSSVIHGSIVATRNALTWLEHHPPRLVVAMETIARYQALGDDAQREWAAIRDEVRQHDGTTPPCVGWLCEHVAAYGRGVAAVDVTGALVVMALGDPTTRSASRQASGEAA